MKQHVLENYIDFFVKEKKLSGDSFRVQERWMQQFKEFVTSHGNHQGIQELMESFYSRNLRESIATQQKRQLLMGQFASYLNKHGIAVTSPEPPDKYFSYPRRIPYIFTKQELASVFRQIDYWETTPYSRGNSTEIDPVIFRMAYGCGMRIMEILTLRRFDVDTNALTIHIRQGKNGRERRIPMALSLAQRCAKYDASMHGKHRVDEWQPPKTLMNIA